MNKSIEGMLNKASLMLAKIEQEHTKIDTMGRVVIYDAATGLFLPGYKPNPNADTNVYLPHNHRDNKESIV